MNVDDSSGMGKVQRAQIWVASIALVALSLVASPQPANAVATDYSSAVLADHPSIYWHLDEGSGTAADASGNGKTGTYQHTTAAQSGYTYVDNGSFVTTADVATPSSSTASVTSNGDGNGVYSNATVNDPETFTEQVWFKTTSTMGGRLIGFGDAAAGISYFSRDRELYLTPSGRVEFAVNDGGVYPTTSPGSYNDGAWHLATATLDATNGAQVFVDGKRVANWPIVNQAQPFNGHWSVGYDSLQYFPDVASQGFYGSLDEASIWNSTALSANQIMAEYSSAGRSVTVGVSVDPSFTFGVSAHSGSCAGTAQTSGTSANATTANLGHLGLNSSSVAAQDLNVSSNAGGGIFIYFRYVGQMNDGHGHTIADVPGNGGYPSAQAFPATGTAAFGYTLGWLGANQWMPFTTSNASNLHLLIGAQSDCVAYKVQTDSVTPAATYNATIIYTAIPVF